MSRCGLSVPRTTRKAGRVMRPAWCSVEPVTGLEPATHSLQNCCATIAPHWRALETRACVLYDIMRFRKSVSRNAHKHDGHHRSKNTESPATAMARPPRPQPPAPPQPLSFPASPRRPARRSSARGTGDRARGSRDRRSSARDRWAHPSGTSRSAPRIPASRTPPR